MPLVKQPPWLTMNRLNPVVRQRCRTIQRTRRCLHSSQRQEFLCRNDNAPLLRGNVTGLYGLQSENTRSNPAAAQNGYQASRDSAAVQLRYDLGGWRTSRPRDAWRVATATQKVDAPVMGGEPEPTDPPSRGVGGARVKW